MARPMRSRMDAAVALVACLGGLVACDGAETAVPDTDATTATDAATDTTSPRPSAVEQTPAADAEADAPAPVTQELTPWEQCLDGAGDTPTFPTLDEAIAALVDPAWEMHRTAQGGFFDAEIHPYVELFVGPPGEGLRGRIEIGDPGDGFQCIGAHETLDDMYWADDVGDPENPDLAAFTARYTDVPAEGAIDLLHVHLELSERRLPDVARSYVTEGYAVSEPVELTGQPTLVQTLNTIVNAKQEGDLVLVNTNELWGDDCRAVTYEGTLAGGEMRIADRTVGGDSRLPRPFSTCD